MSLPCMPGWLQSPSSQSLPRERPLSPQLLGPPVLHPSSFSNTPQPTTQHAAYHTELLICSLQRRSSEVWGLCQGSCVLLSSLGNCMLPGYLPPPCHPLQQGPCLHALDTGFILSISWAFLSSTSPFTQRAINSHRAPAVRKAAPWELGIPQGAKQSSPWTSGDFMGWADRKQGRNADVICQAMKRSSGET